MEQGVSVRESSQPKDVEPKKTEPKFKRGCKFARGVKAKKHKRNGPETSVVVI
jgi:hypothetical protein